MSAASTAGRSVVRTVVTTVLAAVVLWGIAAGISESSAGGNRVRALTTRLRCPVCQGESVADSPSENAQEITALVEEQIGAGWSDGQIEQYFVDRYGAWILLDPPRSGSTLWLWIAPLVAVTVGAVAVVSRLGPSRTRRVLVGGSAALGAASVVLLVVLGAAERHTRAGDAPALGAELPSGRDLSAVTNEEMEAVVAQSPTVVGMRLALAERYLRDGDIDAAHRHTATAIDLPATDQEYEHALRLHGWVTALLGGPASGAEYLRAALSLSPDDRDAQWFLANVEWTGLGNAQEATRLLDKLLASEPAPAQVERIESLLAEIAAAADRAQP